MASAPRRQVNPGAIKSKGQCVSQDKINQSEVVSEEGDSHVAVMGREQKSSFHSSQTEREKCSETARVAASNSRRLHVPLLHPPLRLLLAPYLSQISFNPTPHLVAFFLHLPPSSQCFFPFFSSKEWRKQVHKIPEANSAAQNSTRDDNCGRKKTGRAREGECAKKRWGGW